jgi:hypothetical protein
VFRPNKANSSIDTVPVARFSSANPQQHDLTPGYLIVSPQPMDWLRRSQRGERQRGARRAFGVGRGSVDRLYLNAYVPNLQTAPCSAYSWP